MRIAMIGGGYVGLVSGACFAEFGTDVTIVEVDAAKLAALHEGRMPIYEPGLDKLVADNVKAGRLSFGADLAKAVAAADAVFIAVGTPTRRGDGHADLTYVYAAAAEIAESLGNYTVVVTKSTVPVGTGREVARIIREARPEAEFDVADGAFGRGLAEFAPPSPHGAVNGDPPGEGVVVEPSGRPARPGAGAAFRPESSEHARGPSPSDAELFSAGVAFSESHCALQAPPGGSAEYLEQLTDRFADARGEALSFVERRDCTCAGE